MTETTIPNRDASQPPPIGIRSLAYYFEETKPIEAIPFLAANPALLADCRTEGFERFSRSRNIVLQSLFSAGISFVSCGMQRADVDAVVIGIAALHVYRRPFEEISEQILRLLKLKESQVVGVMTGGCANFASALRVAHNMVAAEGYRNVLVIETDVSLTDDDRVIRLGDGVSHIMGDGAASCFVTRDKPDFILAGMDQVALPIEEKDPDAARRATNKLLGSRRVIGRALENAGVTRNEVTKIFIPNMGAGSFSMFSEMHGFPEHLLYRDNLARTAHVWSADPLIAMQDYASRESPPTGSCFLAYSFGVRYFSAMVFRKA